MVYLLKWLISLITPHTHNKEGKQGNSFIVRKALGNRASFSSLASKKGSSLLLVVMTMSVIIVISSSFMLLSFNTGIGSIFASSQQKAQLSCLSVAEGLKDGNTFGNIYSFYNNQPDGWAAGTSKSFVANNTGLYGTTEVTMTKTDSSHVGVVVETRVGKSYSVLKFTHTLQSNSVRDVINQVSNSMAVSGGGSFSMQADKVDGDISLGGNYLLALRSYSEVNEHKDGQIGYTTYPGEIDGNVYCNGDMVLGYKGKDIEIYLEEDWIYKDRERKYSNNIATIITKNLYVNGNLVINSCEIYGDVYVSGNVLVNGLTDSMRGGSDGKSYYDAGSNVIIHGNLYVGGSLYVTTGSFARFYPDDEKVVGDGGDNTYTGGYTFEYKVGLNPKQDDDLYDSAGFPKFPTEYEIKNGASDYSFDNTLEKLYNSSINSKKDVTNDTDSIIFTYNDGTQEVLSRDLLSSNVVSNGNIKFRHNDKNYIFKQDDKTRAEVKADTTAGNVSGRKIVVYAYNCMRYEKISVRYGVLDYRDRYRGETAKEKRAYNALFNLLTGSYWSSQDHSSIGSDDNSKNTTLTNTLVYDYETRALRASAENINENTFKNQLNNSQLKTLTVSRNVYVQNNAYVQIGAKQLGKITTYILGDLDTFSISGACTAEGAATDYETNVSFANLYVGGKVRNHVFYTQKLIESQKNYYFAYMSICGTSQETSSTWQNDDTFNNTLFEKNKEYALYDKDLKGYNRFSLGSYLSNNNMKYYQASADKFKAENIGKGSNEKGVEGTTKVTGIMAYGAYATFATIDNNVLGLKSTKPTLITLDKVDFSGTKYTGMYDSEFLRNHNNVSRDDQIRTTSPKSVIDVFKEMGVYGYDAIAVTKGDYKKGYEDDANGNYYYPNLSKTGSTKEYKIGDNKINDPEGVNFTGVTAAAQIKFGYTIERAITASNSAIWVKAKGALGRQKKFLWFNTSIDWSYVNDRKLTIDNDGKSNIKALTEKYILTDTEKDKLDSNYAVRDTFYGRLLFLGSDTNRATLERVVGLLYTGTGDWETYGKHYAGVYGKVGDEFCIYIMRDMVLSDGYYGFGDGVEKNLRLYIDASYSNINIYWGSDSNGVLNFADSSYIQTSMLYPQGKLNVAYIFIIPNIACADSIAELRSENGTILSTLSDKKNHISFIMSKESPLKEVGTDDYGQKIYFCSQNGKYYKYSTKTYKVATNASGKDLQTLGDVRFSNFVMMWDDSKVRNSATFDNGEVTAAAIPMFMSEGPMLFTMYENAVMNGVVYMPNPKSIFFCGSEGTVGTTSDEANTLSGGAIVAGKVYGIQHSKSTWQYYTTTKDGEPLYDIGERLTQALIDTKTGLGDISVDNGTNSTANWSAGEYT